MRLGEADWQLLTVETIPSLPALADYWIRADLLPPSAWGSNLRGILTRYQWDKLRFATADAAGNSCEVCGHREFLPNGRPRRPDCHELWVFEIREGRLVQRLDRLIGLCIECHALQHIGRSSSKVPVAKILRRRNNWTRRQARADIRRAWVRWKLMSRLSFDLDLTALRGQIVVPGWPGLVIPAQMRSQLGNSLKK